MRHRTFRGAAVLATALFLASATIAFADTVPADGDSVSAGNQVTISLGERAPGEIVKWDVALHLTCAGTSHPASGAVIDVALAGATVPLDGDASTTGATIGPVPSDWPASGQGCPSPTPILASNGPTVVTLTMPTTPGQAYSFSLLWGRSGASGLSGFTVMTFNADVVGNTPPTLSLPDALTIEGNATNGATVDYAATATDAQDDPDPTAGCSRASGSLFGLGTTTVDCDVTDSGGMTASGAFDITVVDTTPPSLAGVPASAAATTSNPAGAAVAYPAPTATDVVDPNPSVDCLPASGSVFPIGSSTVTCTATDATGNQASDSFPVTVTFVPPVAWSAAWGEPVSSPGDTFVANSGRTIPVKVTIFADGVEQTTGHGALSIAGCGGGGSLEVALGWDGGRWNGHLDTSRLDGPGCYLVGALLDGHEAGSFRLDLRGNETAATQKGANK
jgi:hypothetical protein